MTSTDRLTGETTHDISNIVGGSFADGFERVVFAFRETLNDLDDSGAALSIWVRGEEVVNVWGGVARENRGWDENTLSVIFSATKGLAAVTLGTLVQESLLDLDSSLSSIWPEFAAHGKGSISIADVLAHRAGLSAPREDLVLEDILDSRAWAKRLAAQEPLWKPGRGHAYHALSFGPLVQEIVRRVTGRELHEELRERVADPLGADITLRPTLNDLNRSAWLTTTPEWDSPSPSPQPEADKWIGRALTLGGALPRGLVNGSAGFNDPLVRAAGLAGAGALGTASAVARIWSATVTETHGYRLLQPDTVSLLTQPRSVGVRVFDSGAPHPRWGAGVGLSSEVSPGLSSASFGHGGAGGQVAFADPRHEVGFCFLRSRMDVAPATRGIVAALRTSLGLPARLY